MYKKLNEWNFHFAYLMHHANKSAMFKAGSESLLSTVAFNYKLYLVQVSKSSDKLLKKHQIIFFY